MDSPPINTSNISLPKHEQNATEVIKSAYKSTIAEIKRDGTLILPALNRGIFHRLIYGNLKYKIATTLLLLGGAYAFYKYWQQKAEEEAAIEAEENEYKEDEYENEITYLEMDERSLCRRLVARFWVPTDKSKFALFDTMQTTKEIEEQTAVKVWHYAEIDKEALGLGSIGRVHHHDHDTMPDELLFLSRATKILGHFDKQSMMATWKNIDSIELKQGEYLFHIGDPDIFVYVLLTGLVQITISDPDVQSREKFKKPYLKLRKVRPGQQIYSTLSFLDVITGHPGVFKSIEAFAIEDSVVLKIPVVDFKNNWYEQPLNLNAAVRRLVRRVYQVVFVAMHRVIGLSVEVTNQSARKPLDPAFVADQSTVVPPELRAKVIAAARKYLEMEEDIYTEYFNASAVVVLPRGANPVKAGTRSNRFVFVYEGELEVSSNMEFVDDDQDLTSAEKEAARNMEEILYYVPAGEAVGGLSYLTDGVNIFNLRIPEKALIFVMPENVLIKLMTDYPMMVLKIVHSVVLRMSSFMRQMDFGLGDESDETYLVLSGRLRSFVPKEKGEKVIGEYGRDDWIGLIETLTKKRRSKTVVAVRDTELAKIPDGVLHLIKLKFPVVTMRLLDFIGARLSKTYKFGQRAIAAKSEGTFIDGPRACSTVTLVPISNQTPTLCVAFELYLAYKERYGNPAIVTYANVLNELGPGALAKSNDYLLTSWLSAQEEKYDLVIYVACFEPNRWCVKCVRQADAILILGNTLADSWDVSPVELMINKEAPTAKKELILLHRFVITESTTTPKVYPQGSKNWIERRPWLSFHHHIGLKQKALNFLDANYERIENEYLTEAEKIADIYSDFSRLSRWISGNSVGLVLGGGGAKGAAHLGIIRVMRERKIPIDLIAGVRSMAEMDLAQVTGHGIAEAFLIFSIGSFVGGLYAMHQDIDLIDKVAHSWFEKIGSWWRFFLDFTIPIVAAIKGDGFNFTVREAHGDVQIEDLWLPYFCLSTNITANSTRIHRSGMLWRYSRASMTLAMLNPPMCDPLDGHYLMDGGYTNLVPANVMRQIGAKYILAVDVSAESEKITTNYGDSLSGVKIVLHKILPFLKPLFIPTYFGVIEQLAFVQSALYLEIVKKMDRQSLYIRPPIDCFSSKDFASYRDILLVGYDFGKRLMQNVNETDSLSIMWQKMDDDLPAVEAKPQMKEQKERIIFEPHKLKQTESSQSRMPQRDKVEAALQRIKEESRTSKE